MNRSNGHTCYCLSSVKHFDKYKKCKQCEWWNVNNSNNVNSETSVHAVNGAVLPPSLIYSK